MHVTSGQAVKPLSSRGVVFVAVWGTVLFVAGLGPMAGATGSYWNQFRGPQGDGKVLQAAIPGEFGETKNVRWKTAIHDEGWSSPVVWDNQVWLTAARKNGAELFAVSVDLQSGSIVKDIKVFDVAAPQPAREGYNTHATPTPYVEEGRIYVHFGAYGTACLDTRTGQKLWERRDLKCDHRVRPASSPIVDGDRLFLVFDGVDVQFVVALDKNTGQTVWQRERKSEIPSNPEGKDSIKKPRQSFATPTIIEYQGRKQLISPAAAGTFSYDPATGQEIWWVRHDGSCWNGACRPVFENGLVYVTTGYAKQLLAIRPDGEGDVTSTHVVWKTRENVPSVSSPVVVNNLVFMVSDSGGMVSCLEAGTGVKVWQNRLGSGRDHWASPLAVNGKIYFSSKDGEVTVISAAREFQVLASHKFNKGFIAGPAVVGDALLFRSEEGLYLIAEGAGSVLPESAQK
jgi:outer membrane protein assembly factor BamB